jgi:hypothetical protein
VLLSPIDQVTLRAASWWVKRLTYTPSSLNHRLRSERRLAIRTSLQEALKAQLLDERGSLSRIAQSSWCLETDRLSPALERIVKAHPGCLGWSKPYAMWIQLKNGAIEIDVLDRARDPYVRQLVTIPVTVTDDWTLVTS